MKIDAPKQLINLTAAEKSENNFSERENLMCDLLNNSDCGPQMAALFSYLGKSYIRRGNNMSFSIRKTAPTCCASSLMSECNLFIISTYHS